MVQIVAYRPTAYRTGNLCTGRFLTETFIFASTNPQGDERLFIELRVQYMKITRSEHVVNRNCFYIQNNSGGGGQNL